MQGVILAAGMGSRIRNIHAQPKGFITLGEEPIIQESILQLKAQGIEDIAIITGYSADYYDAFAKGDPSITTIFNEHYHCYGNLYSLYCARHFIVDDFLLLESDIIFEPEAISDIINDPNPNVILLSGKTDSGDEVYVEASAEKLIRMSKQKNKLNLDAIYGEFVGINKISFTDYCRLMYCLDHDPALLQTGCYDEDGLVMMTNYTDVHCLKKSNLIWSEIDNEVQLARARVLYEKMHYSL